MKKYNKNKFRFLNYDKTYRNPKEDEIYINKEFRFISQFPFLKKVFVAYVFENNYWNEYDLNKLQEK